MKPKKRSAGAVKGSWKKDPKDLKPVQKERVLRVKKNEDKQTCKGKGKIKGKGKGNDKSKGKGRQKQQHKEREKKTKTEKDPNLPKKPATAFFYYMEEFRKTYQKENPGVTGMREIGIACGIKWKELTYEEKAPYYDIATQKRAEYEKILAAYRKKKEAGEEVEAHEAPGKTNSVINDGKEGGEEAGKEVEAHQGPDKTNSEINDDKEGGKEAGEEVEVHQEADETNLKINDDKEGGEQEDME